MKNKIGFVAIIALGATSLFAQEAHLPVNLGLVVGIPVTDMFSANNTTLFGNSNQLPGGYSAAVPRYEFGVTGEFHLPYGLRFEVDGLVKRGGFASSFGPTASTSIYNNTGFTQWEIPGLIKKNLAMGHFRPFVEVGASLRHISSIDSTTFGVAPSGLLSDNSSALVHRNSYGGVAGFGMTFKKGPFELTPEARYTRWANQSFSADGLRTNLDQGDVLLGITF
jgi:hypothetical protein